MPDERRRNKRAASWAPGSGPTPNTRRGAASRLTGRSYTALLPPPGHTSDDVLLCRPVQFPAPADAIPALWLDLTTRKELENLLLYGICQHLSRRTAGQLIEKWGTATSSLAPSTPAARQRGWILLTEEGTSKLRSTADAFFRHIVEPAGWVVPDDSIPYLMCVPTGAAAQRNHRDSSAPGVYTASMHVYTSHRLRMCCGGRPVAADAWEVMLHKGVHHGLANAPTAAFTFRLCIDGVHRRTDATAAAAWAARSGPMLTDTETVDECPCQPRGLLHVGDPPIARGCPHPDEPLLALIACALPTGSARGKVWPSSVYWAQVAFPADPASLCQVGAHQPLLAEPVAAIPWPEVQCLDAEAVSIGDCASFGDLVHRCLTATAEGRCRGIRNAQCPTCPTDRSTPTAAVGTAGAFVGESVLTATSVLICEVAARHGVVVLPLVTSHGQPGGNLTQFRLDHCPEYLTPWWTQSLCVAVSMLRVQAAAIRSASGSGSSSVASAASALLTARPPVLAFTMPVHVTPTHWAYVAIFVGDAAPVQYLILDSLPDSESAQAISLAEVAEHFLRHLHAILRVRAPEAAHFLERTQPPTAQNTLRIVPPSNGLNSCGLFPHLMTIFAVVWVLTTRASSPPPPGGGMFGQPGPNEQWRRRAFAALLEGDTRAAAACAKDLDDAVAGATAVTGAIPAHAKCLGLLPPMSTEKDSFFAPPGVDVPHVGDDGKLRMVAPAADAAGAASVGRGGGGGAAGGGEGDGGGGGGGSSSSSIDAGIAGAAASGVIMRVPNADWWREGPAPWLRQPESPGAGLMTRVDVNPTMAQLSSPPAHGFSLASFCKDPATNYKEPFVIPRTATRTDFPTAMRLRGVALPMRFSSAKYVAVVIGGTAGLACDGFWVANAHFTQFWRNVWVVARRRLPAFTWVLVNYGKAYWVAGRSISRSAPADVLEQWPPRISVVRSWAIDEGYFAAGSVPSPTQLSVLVPSWLDTVLNPDGVVNPPNPAPSPPPADSGKQHAPRTGRAAGAVGAAKSAGGSAAGAAKSAGAGAAAAAAKKAPAAKPPKPPPKAPRPPPKAPRAAAKAKPSAAPDPPDTSSSGESSGGRSDSDSSSSSASAPPATTPATTTDAGAGQGRTPAVGADAGGGGEGGPFMYSAPEWVTLPEVNLVAPPVACIERLCDADIPSAECPMETEAIGADEAGPAVVAVGGLGMSSGSYRQNAFVPGCRPCAVSVPHDGGQLYGVAYLANDPAAAKAALKAARVLLSQTRGTAFHEKRHAQLLKQPGVTAAWFHVNAGCAAVIPHPVFAIAAGRIGLFGRPETRDEFTLRFLKPGADVPASPTHRSPRCSRGLSLADSLGAPLSPARTAAPAASTRTASSSRGAATSSRQTTVSDGTTVALATSGAIPVVVTEAAHAALKSELSSLRAQRDALQTKVSNAPGEQASAVSRALADERLRITQEVRREVTSNHAEQVAAAARGHAVAAHDSDEQHGRAVMRSLEDQDFEVLKQQASLSRQLAESQAAARGRAEQAEAARAAAEAARADAQAALDRVKQGIAPASAAIQSVRAQLEALRAMMAAQQPMLSPMLDVIITNARAGEQALT